MIDKAEATSRLEDYFSKVDDETLAADLKQAGYGFYEKLPENFFDIDNTEDTDNAEKNIKGC